MKLVTANKLKRLWNNGFVPKLLEKLDKTRVLTSTEQVQANTNAENVVGALVAKELINELTALTDGGAITGMEAREDGVYITYVPSAGADPVTKKLGSTIYLRTQLSYNSNSNTNSQYIYTSSLQVSTDGKNWNTVTTCRAPYGSGSVSSVYKYQP